MEIHAGDLPKIRKSSNPRKSWAACSDGSSQWTPGHANPQAVALIKRRARFATRGRCDVHGIRAAFRPVPVNSKPSGMPVTGDRRNVRNPETVTRRPPAVTWIAAGAAE